MKHEDERMDEYIREKLNKLSHTPPRDPAKASQTRASFLAQVKAHSPAPDLSSPVPLSPSLRLKGWINQVLGSTTRKESHRMLQAITALFVIGAMLFGGAGATVYAAQDALPNDALYTLKTATEDLRLAFALDAQSELDLLLNYSDRRMSEVLALSKAGEAIPQDVIVRLNAEMDLVEDIITDLDEPELSEAVEKVQVLIRDRDRDSWPEDEEYDMVRLLATRAWTEVAVDSLVCLDPIDYDPIANPEVECNEFVKVCLEPDNYDPILNPEVECIEFMTEWVWEQPDPQFRFRNETAPRNEDAKGPEWEEEITDTETLTDTVELMLEGSGTGAGPGEVPIEMPVGPGPDQGNSLNRDADVGPFEFPSQDTQVGRGPYGSIYEYPFLQYFNMPTPKGPGGGGKK